MYRQTDKDDYYGPLLINAGSKICNHYDMRQAQSENQDKYKTTFQSYCKVSVKEAKTKACFLKIKMNFLKL